MSLLGFNGAETLTNELEWMSGSGTNAQIGIGRGVNAGNSFYLHSATNTFMDTPTFAPRNTCILQAHIKGNELSMHMFRWLDRFGTDSFSVTRNPAGIIEARLGHPTAGTLLGTGVTVMEINQWYYIKIKVLFSNTVGRFEIIIDEIPQTSDSGIDTVDAGQEEWSKIRVMSGLNSVTEDNDFDNIVIMDEQDDGDGFDDFIDECYEAVFQPVNDVGEVNEWTGQAGGPSTAGEVDDSPGDDGDTSENHSNVSGERDLYKVPMGQNGNDILAIQTVHAVKRVEPAIGTLTPLLHTKGGIRELPIIVPPVDSYAYFWHPLPRDPADNAVWLDTDLVQVGQKVT